ncbi:MAG: transglycosylase domain-containing protein [Caldisericaceae bacterium]
MKKRRSLIGAFIKTALIVIVIVVILGALMAALYVKNLSNNLPDLTLLSYSPDQASQIFDYKGNLITNVYAFENRIYVPLDKIAKVLQQAVISQEDKRFYEHGALDYRGMVRALFVTVTSLGGRVEGASTLEQQLARSMFLTNERTIDRKVKEALIAFKIESKFTKDEILEMYLNQVYFGAGAYGVESAAMTYFGKHASDITLPEAAMLAGIIKAPSDINPYADLASAKIAQKEVLDEMLAQNVITQQQYDDALKFQIKLVNAQPVKDNMGYVIDYVKELVADKFGNNMLYAGGLKIYTTIMPQLQLAATKSIDTVLAKAEKDKIFPTGKKDSKGVIQPQASLTAVDANTGAIIAMVGGRDYDNTKFNRSLALKQPGSSFKIFDYTAAMSYGSITPSSIILSDNFTVNNWTPHEWENTYFGELSVRDALMNSSNVAATKTSLSVGLDRVIYTARKLGITTPLMPYPSIAIGSFEVKQLEMADAYATLGNGGIYHPPFIIQRIESSDGKVLYEHSDDSYRAVPDTVAYIMNNMFSYVMLYKSNAKISGLPAAGKTGSTDAWTDAWFDGYTPNISVSVWLGPDSKEVTFPDVLNSGSRFPAMIWHNFMLEAMKYFPKDNFKKPSSGLVSKNVINATGYLTDQKSDGTKVVNYSFLPQFVPPYDTLESGFVTVTVCKDSGLLAPVGCPADLTEQRTYLKGTEPTQYDPRNFGQVNPSISILLSTDKDLYKTGDSIGISASVSGISDVSGYYMNFYVYGMPVAKLASPSYGTTYTYNFIATIPGAVTVKAELVDSNGAVIEAAEKQVTVQSP